MVIGNPYAKYQQNSIMTATPEELTLMLYNGVIKFINQAKLSIEESKMENVHNYIIRAQDIITHLNITLDMNYEISKNLNTLYDFMLEKLIDANIKKSKEPLDEILPLIEDLRDTWKEAMRKAKIEKKVGK